MEIVTGSTGEAHVTPIDDAVRNSNCGYVNDKVVFTYYENLRAQAITANEVRVFSGYGMNQGRIFKIDRNDFDSVTIENGSQGVKRADLIVARYTMDTQTGFEDISLAVIRGQSGSTYVDPNFTTGNINAGDTLDDFPLYRVKINGIVIEAVEALFTPLPDGGRLGELEKKLGSKFKTNLASETAGELDGSENVEIGVKGTLGVNHGGTGKTTNSANSVLVGNGTSAIKNILSRVGAFFSNGENAEPQFGTLPASMGGTGQQSLQATRNAMGLGNTTGALPVANGGTGSNSAASARTALGVPPTSHASTGTGYGKGDATNFGHTKLSDDYNPSTPKTASDGVGASQKAVKDAYNAAIQAIGSAGYGNMMKATYDPDNGGLDETAGGTANQRSPISSGAVRAAITALQTSFQDGVDTIYNAFVGKGVIPTASTPSALATAVGTTYNKGVKDAEADTWEEYFYFQTSGVSGTNAYNVIHLPLFNVVNLTVIRTNTVTIYMETAAGAASTRTITNPTIGTVITPASNERNMEISMKAAGDLVFKITRQAKKLR